MPAIVEGCPGNVQDLHVHERYWPTRHFFPCEVPEFLYRAGVIYLLVWKDCGNVSNICFLKKLPFAYTHVLLLCAFFML